MKAWIKQHRTLIFLILTLMLVALVYFDSFTSPFFQDDKLHLMVRNQGQVWDPIDNFPYYRPISIKVFYSLGFFLGGFSTLPYHLILFAAFAISLITVQKLAFKLLKNEFQANIATLFLALNISLFGIFYLLAGSYVVFGTMFILLAVYFYLKAGSLNFVVATLFALLALGSSELAYVLPGLIAITAWFNGKLQTLKLVFFSALVGLAFLIRKLTLSFPNNSDYDMHLDFSLASNIKWYFFRAINLPEGVQRYESLIFWIVTAVFFAVVVYAAFRYLTSKSLSIKLLIFSILWFLIAGGPYYLMPKHMSSIYIMLALFGPALIFSQLFKTKKLAVVTLVIYLLMTLLGLDFLRDTHWMILKNTGPVGQFTSF